MNCARTQAAIEPFLDGALAGSERIEIADHLAACPDCRARADEIGAVETALRAALADDATPPPADLWPRIQASLAAEAAPAKIETPQRSRLLLLGGLAATVVGAAAFGYLARRPDVLPVWLLEAPVDDLRTFLASRRPVDVATDDPGKLRRWFAGKVDFEAPMPPAPMAGIALVGGRLCYFLHRRGTAYLYRAQCHLISIFAYGGAGLGMPEGGSRTIAGHNAVVRRVNGFTHILWTEGPLIRSVVSELPAARLAKLTAALLSARG